MAEEYEDHGENVGQLPQAGQPAAQPIEESMQPGENIVSNIITLLEKITSYFIEQGLSSRSIYEYERIIKSFLASLNYDLMNLSQDKIKQFIMYNNNPQRSAAIKALCDYLDIDIYEKFRKRNKKLFKLKNQPIRKIINYSEFKVLIPEMKTPYNLIAMIQWDAGLRISAVLNLEIEGINIDDDGDVFLQVLEKGNKRITRYLSKPTGSAIKEYIRIYKIPSGKIFDSLGKHHTAYLKYSKELLRVCQLINFPISSHVIRRSRAVKLIRDGTDFVSVKNFLGHASPETTFKYVELAGQLSKDIIKKETR